MRAENGAVKEAVSITGELRTCCSINVSGEKTTYTVKIGNVLISEYVAEHCTGGYYSIQFHSTARCHQLSGQIDVFMQKTETGYYENGWRVGQEIAKKYKVHLGGLPIETRIGEMFGHKMSRTFYDHGWYRITITRLW